jgi:hypothetical protein
MQVVEAHQARHRGGVQLREPGNDQKLVIVDPFIGEFVIDENFTLEILELIHPHEIRMSLPNGGWRRVSLRMLIALLGRGVVRMIEES